MSESYARTTLLINRPWSDHNPFERNTDWKRLFERFILSSSCPLSVKLTYQRVLNRYVQGLTFAETTAKSEIQENQVEETIDEETRSVLEIVASFTTSKESILDVNGIKLDKGLDYEWDTPKHPVSTIEYLYTRFLSIKMMNFK